MQTLTTANVSAAIFFPRLQTALDSAYEHFQAGRPALALTELIDDLKARRDQQPAEWPAYARACLDHPMCRLLRQDPFTGRAFDKPRGYAGDAVMMDYIYKMGEASEALRNATPIGRSVFQLTDKSPAKLGVRYRRQVIAEMIDHAAERGAERVLAIAAGHLREVELSSAVRTGKIQEFVAFDQDENSLAVIRNDYAHLGIRTVPGSVRHLLARKAKPGQFDVVYAAGLFDYLIKPIATALTCRMFEMTRPGGVMLIPNFLPSVRDNGYMEAVMDWHLIYRDQADMYALADALPQDQVAGCRVFDDQDDAITYLMVTKTN